MGLKLELPKIKLDIFKDGDKVSELAKKAIVAAEKQLGAGKGKRKLNAVADALNKAIDIPYIPEGVEQVLFRMLAQMTFNLVKDQLAKMVSDD